MGRLIAGSSHKTHGLYAEFVRAAGNLSQIVSTRKKVGTRAREDMRILLAGLSILLLSGCLVRTAANVVTLPVKAVSAGVDAVTTSQSEADEKRGRELRKEEERRGREARKAEDSAVQ
jgi:hypothetical protein